MVAGSCPKNHLQVAENGKNGRMARVTKNLRKIKNSNKQKQNEMEIYEIGVHFLIRKENGALETWNLTQNEYYADVVEAKAATNRLRNLFRELGKQLFWLTSPSGDVVWTNDAESYKKIFPYDFAVREVRLESLD